MFCRRMFSLSGTKWIKRTNTKPSKNRYSDSTVLLIMQVVDQTIFCIFIMILQACYKTKSIHVVVVVVIVVVFWLLLL